MRPHQLGDAGDEGKALALEQGIRAVAAIVSSQLRLVVEQLELAGRAAHVQIDHPPRLGRERRRQDRQRCGGIALDLQCRNAGRGVRRRSHRRIHEERAEPAHAPAQELPAGLRLKPAAIQKWGANFHHGFYRVSAASMFNKAVAAAGIPSLASSFRSTASSPGVKSRVRTARAPKLRALVRRSPGFKDASCSMRAASATAAWWNTGSFNVTSACSGVLVVMRRGWLSWRSAASKVTKLG